MDGLNLPEGLAEAMMNGGGTPASEVQQQVEQPQIIAPPVVEQPAQQPDPQPAATAEQPQPTPTEPTIEQQPVVQKTIWEQLKEEVGIEVNSKDEILSVYEKAGKDPFAHQAVKEFNDFVAQGGDPAKWIEYNSLKVENLTPEQRIKAYMAEKFPQLTEREIEVRYRRKYGEYSEDDDSDEAISARADMKIDDIEATQFLQSKKATNLTPPAREEEMKRQQFEAQQEEIRKKHYEVVEKNLSTLTELKTEFQVNNVSDPKKLDKQTFTWKVDDAERKSLIELAKEPMRLVFDLCATADGNALDINKLVDLANFAKNKERYLSAFANNLVSNERERIIQEDLKNTSRTEGLGQPIRSQKSDMDALREQIFSNY